MLAGLICSKVDFVLSCLASDFLMRERARTSRTFVAPTEQPRAMASSLGPRPSQAQRVRISRSVDDRRVNASASGWRSVVAGGATH